MERSLPCCDNLYVSMFLGGTKSTIKTQEYVIFNNQNDDGQKHKKLRCFQHSGFFFKLSLFVKT